MLTNPVIEVLMQRKSIRQFTEQSPSDEVLETVVRAGQQAPFAAQLGSLLLSRKRNKNPFNAPLLFTICADIHRLEAVLERRGWTRVSCDEAMLVFAIQDASYMAENMVIAGESLGMGSCYLGAAPFIAKAIIRQYKLPHRVYPVVQLAMGYPAENPPPRPRYPMAFSLFEDEYPEFTDVQVCDAMDVMDSGYLAQSYYVAQGARIPLNEDREETYTEETYSWTEHMGRKWGKWLRDVEEVRGPLADCGFVFDQSKTRADQA